MRMAFLSIALTGFLIGSCGGRPIPIPTPESELGPPPGMPTGGSGGDFGRSGLLPALGRLRRPATSSVRPLARRPVLHPAVP
jgi:hypothetical protein